MNDFELENKIIWRRNITETISNVFYPSFYKDIQKREAFFVENFDVQFLDATIDLLKKIYLPIYTEEIINRKDFSLNKDTIEQELTQKIETSRIYRFMLIWDKKTLVYAALFSLKNNGLYVGYRALKKDFDKTLSHKATVGYWAEKLIFDYGKKIGAQFFSYGKDSHPYIGKSKIGLPLYKIKTGMRPKKPLMTTPFITEKFSLDFFSKNNEPSLFFSNANNEGFYKDCHLYYPINSLDESYLMEFEKVLGWADIKFNPIPY
jgi:hypothetical protein